MQDLLHLKRGKEFIVLMKMIGQTFSNNAIFCTRETKSKYYLLVVLVRGLKK